MTLGFFWRNNLLLSLFGTLSRKDLNFWQETKGCRNCILSVQGTHLNIASSQLFCDLHILSDFERLILRLRSKKFGTVVKTAFLIFLNKLFRENFCYEFCFLCGLWLNSFWNFELRLFGLLPNFIYRDFTTAFFDSMKNFWAFCFRRDSHFLNHFRDPSKKKSSFWWKIMRQFPGNAFCASKWLFRLWTSPTKKLIFLFIVWPTNLWLFGETSSDVWQKVFGRVVETDICVSRRSNWILNFLW